MVYESVGNSAETAVTWGWGLAGMLIDMKAVAVTPVTFLLFAICWLLKIQRWNDCMTEKRSSKKQKGFTELYSIFRVSKQCLASLHRSIIQWIPFKDATKRISVTLLSLVDGVKTLFRASAAHSWQCIFADKTCFKLVRPLVLHSGMVVLMMTMCAPVFAFIRFILLNSFVFYGDILYLCSRIIKFFKVRHHAGYS